MYLVGREGEVFAAEGDLVLHYLLNDLLVGVLQYDAHFAADVAELFALDVFARDLHFARKFAAVDVGDDAADNVHERALPLARMPGKEGDFAVLCGKIGVFEDLCLSVVGKAHLSEFYRLHKTTANTAPATMPRINSTSERAGYSFL